MNQEQQGRKMTQLIARCWAEEGFTRKLLANAAAKVFNLFHLVISFQPGSRLTCRTSRIFMIVFLTGLFMTGCTDDDFELFETGLDVPLYYIF